MKTIADLKSIKERMIHQLNLRDEEKGTRVVVGMATCGIAAGARPVLNAATEEVAKLGLTDVMVTQTGCIGICQYEPVVEVYHGGEKTTYIRMTADKVKRVIDEHVVNNKPVTEYTFGYEVK